MLADKPQEALYIGMTNDLIGQVWEHREGIIASLTKAYGVKMLVWYERHGSIHQAIAHEVKLKAVAPALENKN
jgi:putative endonuclease